MHDEYNDWTPVVPKIGIVGDPGLQSQGPATITINVASADKNNSR